MATGGGRASRGRRWCRVCSPWSCDAPRRRRGSRGRMGVHGLRARHPRRVRRRQRPAAYPEVDVAAGMVVEDRASGFCGDVVTWSIEAVTLRDRRQHRRHFAWKPGGFLLEGRPVTLRRPAVHASRRRRSRRRARWPGRPGRRRSPRPGGSGSRAATTPSSSSTCGATTCASSAIVVEPMHGIDDLLASVEAFRPSPQRRLGILVDHLVAGSKESRLAAQVRHADVMITGHPFVDVWAGVRPGGARPRCMAGRAAGRAVEGRDVPAPRRRPGAVLAAAAQPGPSYADLRPELVGAVERLIDFVAPA